MENSEIYSKLVNPLSTQEMYYLLANDIDGIGVHIWVKDLDLKQCYAAILDHHTDYGYCAITCLSDKPEYIEQDYGETWLAYLNKPESEDK